MENTLLSGTLVDSGGSTSTILLSDDGTFSYVIIILLSIIAITLLLDFIRRLFAKNIH